MTFTGAGTSPEIAGRRRPRSESNDDYGLTMDVSARSPRHGSFVPINAGQRGRQAVEQPRHEKCMVSKKIAAEAATMYSTS